MPLSALQHGVYVPRGCRNDWRLERYGVQGYSMVPLEVAERRASQLAVLLRDWFGPDAGQAGVPAHYVRFTRWPDGWHATPEFERGEPCGYDNGTFWARVKVNQASGRPILMPIDRKKCPAVPMGDTQVLVYGDPWTFGFRKVAVNTAWPE